jgi:uncharacterized protein (DUF1810 family)
MATAAELDRFLEAQEPVLAQVLRELGAGCKASHWMWFIFPQLQGLGVSPTARFYGLRGLEEACAFLRHPLLGPRLRECTQLVHAAAATSARQMFGTPDDLKLRSSLTLFARAAQASGADDAVFLAVLHKYFGGQMDPRTLALLGD